MDLDEQIADIKTLTMSLPEIDCIRIKGNCLKWSLAFDNDLTKDLFELLARTRVVIFSEVSPV